MSLETHTIDDLRAEIIRRQEAERTELLRQLADLEAQAAAIRAKLGIPDGAKVKAPKVATSGKAPSREDLITFLSGRDAPASPKEVAEALGVTNPAAGVSLGRLVASGEARRIGEKRGTRYELMGKSAVVVD